MFNLHVDRRADAVRRTEDDVLAGIGIEVVDTNHRITTHVVHPCLDHDGVALA
jgi:hypothetical protein